MKENKNNELKKDALEQVAGGVGPEAEKLTAKIGERNAALERCDRAADALKKASEDFLAKAKEMRERETAKIGKLDKILDYLTFGQGSKWFR